MIRRKELQPMPRDGLTTQITDLGRQSRAAVMGNAGPGLLQVQTVIGMAVQVDPMAILRQGFGRGRGARGPARWA